MARAQPARGGMTRHELGGTAVTPGTRRTYSPGGLRLHDGLSHAPRTGTYPSCGQTPCC